MPGWTTAGCNSRKTEHRATNSGEFSKKAGQLAGCLAFLFLAPKESKVRYIRWLPLPLHYSRPAARKSTIMKNAIHKTSNSS
jgi:hypothetical protein